MECATSIPMRLRLMPIALGAARRDRMAWSLATRQRRFGRALARRRFPQGLPACIRRRLAKLQRLCRGLWSRGARSGIARGVLDVPHLPRINGELTRQGKGDGTLQLIPIAESMVYVLLRALQDDVGGR